MVEWAQLETYFEVTGTPGVHGSSSYIRYWRPERGRYRKFFEAIEKAQAEAEARDGPA